MQLGPLPSLPVIMTGYGYADVLPRRLSDQRHEEIVFLQHQRVAAERLAISKAPSAALSARISWPLLSPLLLAVLASVLINLTSLDLLVSGYFYNPATGQWAGFDYALARWFYRCGNFPSYVLATFGVCWALWGWYVLGCRDETARGLLLTLLLAIGPGLIINAGFKEHWGRPRPKDVQQMGGTRQFHAWGVPNQIHLANSSFPSGHAAAAFYLICPAFLLRSRRSPVAWYWLAFGLTYGGLMSMARVAQGGHFLSDCLWSLVVVYLTGAVLHRWLIVVNTTSAEQPHNRRQHNFRMTLSDPVLIGPTVFPELAATARSLPETRA